MTDVQKIVAGVVAFVLFAGALYYLIVGTAILGLLYDVVRALLPVFPARDS